MMAIYGLFVSTHRDEFPTPLSSAPCKITFYNDASVRRFGKAVYIIAVIPLVNVGLLCTFLIGFVWLTSWIVTLAVVSVNQAQLLTTILTTNKVPRYNISHRAAHLVIFNVLWLFVCTGIILAVSTTTEILLFGYTDSQSVGSFGGLLALALLLVPTETFFRELYHVLVSEERRDQVEGKFWAWFSSIIF